MKGKGLYPAQPGLLPVRPGAAVLVAVLGVLAFGIGGTARLGMADIEVIPPHPTTEDPIVLVLSGTWKDSCVPQAPRVTILGNRVTVATYNPSRVCLRVPSPWKLTVPIGRLPAGTYFVTVTYSSPTTLPHVIGQTSFTVRRLVLLPTPLTLTGTTDAEGKFGLPLPWPGTTASGRLIDWEGRPLALQSFSLTIIAKDTAIASPGDITGFTISVPGYAKKAVTRFSVFSLFGLTSFLLGDVRLEEADLPWSADRPLTWDDFQGDPPEDAEDRQEAAEIHMEVGYSYRPRTWFDRPTGKWKAHLTEVTTTNTMDRSKSWVLPDHKTPELLNHEQKHFDLNEVYRRLLDAALRELVCTEVTGATKKEAEQNLGKKLDEVFDKFNKKLDEVQEQYDKETDHGRNADKQKEWDKKISDWLADPKKAPQP